MLIRIFETERDAREELLSALTAEAAGPDSQLQQAVAQIIADVRERGDEAVREISRKYDSPNLQAIQVTEAEFEQAYASVKPELLQAIRTAKSNIEAFHRKQLQKTWMDMQEDFVYGQVVRPIGRVGVHVPGALAPLASTVLMTVAPAIVAGVKEVVICTPTPPQPEARIADATLVAAAECGVRKVFKAGGAAAVAAMAFGTETVPKVDKIVGPGNRFSQEAKRQVFGVVGIDSFAGPSEILILADDTANPAFIAADMLSQAEHAPDSRCALFTPSRACADAVLKEIRRQAETAPRKDIIKQSLEQFGVVVITRSLDECIELANIFAPEHLEIALQNAWDILRLITNAGTIMVGQYTPVPLCDFAAGPNHVLPTSGTARFTSALSVDDFVKKSGLLSYTKTALQRIAPTVYEMAEAEGLDAHANTLRVRLNETEAN